MGVAFFLLALTFIVIFQYNGLYRVNILITRAAHLAQILKAFYYGALSVILISLLVESYALFNSKLLIFVFVLTSVPLLYIIRIELLRLLFIKFSNTRFKRNVIIIGDGKSGKMLATKLMYENPIGLNILGFIDDNKEINEEIVIGKRIIGHMHHLKDMIESYNVNELLVAVNDDDIERTLQLIDYCKSLNVKVRVSSEIFDVVTRTMETEKYFDVPVIDVSSRYNNSLTIAMKRSFDIAISAFALIFLSPLMLIITFLIKISSPGPIFFIQKRIGKQGKEFKFYKFRSMVVMEGEDNFRKKEMINFMKDENNELKKKIINGDRVTWIGKIIRRTSMDELPQLLNVLLGDMSLVGPRPCLPYEYEFYDHWQKRRVNVVPGCTGVWQVWGRSSVSFKESVVLDLYYINNMSPWFDLQLMFQTIPAILSARGAK
jgi:undecaprenyl-phosphate galactose phosphotransferase